MDLLPMNCFIFKDLDCSEAVYETDSSHLLNV